MPLRARHLVRRSGTGRGAVQVGRRVLVASAVVIDRRRLGGLCRPRALWRDGGVAEQLRAAGRAALQLPGLDQRLATAGGRADVGAVAVEALRLAGEPDHRVPELLVVLDV